MPGVGPQLAGGTGIANSRKSGRGGCGVAGSLPLALTVLAVDLTTSVTPTPNRLQLLVLHQTANGSTNPTAPSSITGCGLTFAPVAGGATRNAGSSRGICYVYAAQAASTSTGTLTLTGATGTTNGGNRFVWVEIANAAIGSNGLAAIVQSRATGVLTTTTPSVSFLAPFTKAANCTFGVCGTIQPNFTTVTTVVDSPLVAVAGGLNSYTAVGFYQGEDASPSATATASGNCNMIGLELTAA